MTVPVLFLDSASGHSSEVDQETAIATAKSLIATLRAARRFNRKLALNTTDSLRHCPVSSNWTLGAALGGSAYREEWDFVRQLADRSPLSNGLEDWLTSFAEIEVSTPSGIVSQALAWAMILETGTISFGANADWREAWINALCLELDEAGDAQHSTRHIRNASSEYHLAEHEEWLRALGFDDLPSGRELWASREARFPGLRFLSRVEADIEKLSTTGAPYRQALDGLQLLSSDSLRWPAATAWPELSGRVTPEHSNRRKLCYATDEFTGKSELFDWHSRFTGGFEGRIHFRIDAAEHKIVVAYVGFKLSQPIEGK